MPYGRDAGIMDEKYDNAFKQIITAGWAEDTEGAVDDPVGFCSIIPIPRNEYDELVAAVFDEGDPVEVPPAGYYITSENSDGIIRVFTYDRRGDMDADWQNLLSEYAYGEGV